jgi:hypothetical protein
MERAHHFLCGEQGGIHRYALPKPILRVNFTCASMKGEQQEGTGMEDPVEFPECRWHLRALQVDEAIECCDACERRWWEVEGTHIPFVKWNVGMPLGCTLDHRG